MLSAGAVDAFSCCCGIVDDRHRRCCDRIRFDRAHEHGCCFDVDFSTRRRDREGAWIDEDMATTSAESLSSR